MDNHEEQSPIEFQFDDLLKSKYHIVVALKHFQSDFFFHVSQFQTDDAKSSDPDTFEEEEDEVEMNDLEKRLPSGYETVRNNVIDSNFSCKERDTGFYADVENDCQVSGKT